MGNPGGIAEVADDLSPIVDLSGRASHGTGKVDGGEITRAKEEAVRISRRVEVGANDLAQVVHALKKRGSSAGKIKDGEDTVVKQVAVPHVVAVQNAGLDRPRRIEGCERSLAQQIPVAHTGGVAVVPHDVTMIVNPNGARPIRAREVDGGEVEGPTYGRGWSRKLGDRGCRN